MKNRPPRGMQADPLLFGLTDESLEYRNRWVSRARGRFSLLLGGLTFLLLFFLATDNIQRIAILVLAAAKYILVLSAIFNKARGKAASYLADIFELDDPAIAEDFIQDVAFGYGKEVTYGEWAEMITINDGGISEKDERSHIIRIGGPGYIQVNLDSVALLERVDGFPEIIEPRGEPWKLGRFERIREIGKSDEVGQREYAIINLRDQFVQLGPVKSRTKDGIPLEALDIKVMFSILRKSEAGQTTGNPHNYAENAVHSLVYDQVIIDPQPSKNTGVAFPWDTTLIPLVSGELEMLISSNNLSEILASISEKELDSLSENEAANKQIRFQMTGKQNAENEHETRSAPAFQTRSALTERFYEDEFKQKAAKLGLAIHWIDIGTWQLASESIILEELKAAWKLMSVNARRGSELEQLRNQHQMTQLMQLVNNVIIGSYSKSGSQGSSRKMSIKEYEDLAKVIEQNPDIAFSSSLLNRFSHDAAAKRDSNTIALDILKAFRRELIAARELIQREVRSSTEKDADIRKIDNALKDINHHASHYVKGTP